MEDLIEGFAYIMDSGPSELKLLFWIAILGALALCIFFLPEKKRAGLSPKLQAVHDFLNFKVFIIEKILQYVYLTLSLLMFLLGLYVFVEGESDGLLVAIIGPVVIRILYEAILMFVVMVKNVIQINKKIPGQTQNQPAPQAPAAPVTTFEAPVSAAPAQEVPMPGQTQQIPDDQRVYCTMCGAAYDKRLGKCPECGY